ncbi:MAG: HAD-IC family P-type ATPase [Acidimicrobiales bacterium]
MNPLAVVRDGATGSAAALSNVLDRLSPGRRRRRLWTGRGKAHIELRAVQDPERAGLARDVERALHEIEGVHWAEVNAVIGRVVVAFDPEGPSIEDLVEVIEDVERAYEVHNDHFPHERPEHPGDIEPLRRQAIAIGADVVALGGGVFTQLLRATPIPAELGSLVSIAENEPRVRRFLEQHVGVAVTDLGLGITGAFVQSLSQGPLALLSDITHRANQVGELRAARRAWERREGDLSDSPRDEALVATMSPARARPLGSGPVEAYADVSGALSLAGAAATLALTGSPRRAGGILTAAVPKGARHGREAFAARLGRELAARDVVVLDRQALRRLDRVHTVVLDAAVLTTGRLALGAVVPVAGYDAAEIGLKALALFDPSYPQRTTRRGAWTISPMSSINVELPRGAGTRERALRRGRPGVLGVARSGHLVGMIAFEVELDPLAEPLAQSVRQADRRLVVAGARHGLGERLAADGLVAGGSRLAASVRSLQEDGRGVLLVSGSAHAALRAADVGVGIEGHGSHPPWGAALLTRPGLADAHLVVQSLPTARVVSKRSVTLAAAGSATGAAWSLFGPAGSASRRAAVPVNIAALAAQVAGTMAASSLGRRPAPSPVANVAWHAMSPDAVLRALGSSRRGLSATEARRRHAELPVEGSPRVSFARAMATELANPLTPVLAAGAGLAAAVGSVSDAGLVAGVTAANALIGGVQRARADASIDELLHSMTTQVDVRRGGRVLAMERSRLVRGDILELKAGDVVPADCRILEAVGCEVDESSLTGESFPVVKSASPVTGALLADRTSMVYEGSVVATGSAVAVVVGVRGETEVGRSLADTPPPPESGVEARLSTLTKLTVPVTVASGAAVAGLGLLRGRSPRAAVTSGVSLMVAAVPEGLPVLATVAQLAAAHRLAERGAIVRNPRTIEALGRVDVLCFDKTGTLTAGHIALQRVSDGDVYEAVDEMTPRSVAVLGAALRASPITGEVDDLPHATDRAVLEGGERAGVDGSDGLGGWRLLGELAFEPERGYHAVIGDSPRGPRVSVKGAPEIVLPRCTTWRSPEGVTVIDRSARRRLDAEVERLASQGLRVLAVAERPASTRPHLADERVSDMQLLGFLGLADGVRPTAAAAVADLRAAGVSVVMMTGDHPATAAAIAKELEILNGVPVLTGADLDSWSDGELDAALGEATVFARVTPAHKMRIVRAYQRIGRIVAMTGDGANDAPAIRLAHTGIALGGRGSAAARDAADLIVLDDRIETIIDAIGEGRAMWASVRDAVAILIGGNLGEIGFIVSSTAITGASPLGARQLLLVNLLTDMLPAMTIALRAPDRRSPEELLHEGPEASLGGPLVRQIGLRAATTAAGAMGGWALARSTGSSRRASTVALAALVGTQLGQTAALGVRSPVVLASTFVSAGVLVGIIQTPGVSHFFGCRPIGPVGWGIAIGSSAVATGASVVAPWAIRVLPDLPALPHL